MKTTLSTIVDAYQSQTPTSARLAREAKDTFPSGVTHDARLIEPYPTYVARAAGSHKWDVDGNEYIDYSGGHGALLLGHCHPEVVAAVQAQMARGTHFGACHELELQWGQLVQQLVPSAERVRFTSSGTEATLLALRLGRAFTGRDKIVRFAGHFHGWHDHMAFGVASRYDGSAPVGVLPQIAESVVLAPPTDLEATRATLEQHRPAAVIIEPTGASWGQVPVTEPFLRGLREITSELGVVLIFDEVISGFRCSPGGAQGHYGIVPDVTTLAKILAGGLPGGAVVGKKEILDGLDASAAQASGREKVVHHGTFNANPLSAAAGIATLKIVAETDACQKANDYAARLRDALNAVLADEGVDWLVHGTFSGFHVFTNPDHLSLTQADVEAGRYDHTVLKNNPKPLVTKLRLAMLLHGVELFGWPGGPTSAVHTDDDLNQTADAFRAALKMLREESELGE